MLTYFYLGHSYLTRRSRAFIFYMYISCGKHFMLYHDLWPSNLDLEVWPYLVIMKKCKLGHNFRTRRGRVFIFHTCILMIRPCTLFLYFCDLLTLQVDLHLSKKNLGFDFWIKKVKVADGMLCCCLFDNSGLVWSVLTFMLFDIFVNIDYVCVHYFGISIMPPDYASK